TTFHTNSEPEHFEELRRRRKCLRGVHKPDSGDVQRSESRRAGLFGRAGLFLEKPTSHVTRGGVTSLMLLLVEELQIWRKESCDRKKITHFSYN
ncbi:hypothetical protein MHYP_G00305650, partial [Metynnis hypsauchen]